MQPGKIASIHLFDRVFLFTNPRYYFLDSEHHRYLFFPTRSSNSGSMRIRREKIDFDD